MVKKIFALVILSILTLPLYAVNSYSGQIPLYISNDSTVSVLFIGNSLTSANNLPAMVADIAKSNGYRMAYESYAPGGARLFNHASNPGVQKKIESRAWDFVVLQEQSQYPGFSKKQLKKDVFPYAKRLSEMIKDANDQSSVVFYMTMARRNGDPANKNVSSELLTYEGMQKRVNRCYVDMGEDNRAWIAPVGEVWKSIRKKRPNLNLYADNVHPNTTGTYLAACVFYSVFFNSLSIDSYIPKHVEKVTARYIQETVDVVMSRGIWDLR